MSLPASMPAQAAYPVAMQAAPATYGNVNTPTGTAGLPWTDTSTRAPAPVAGGPSTRRNTATTNRGAAAAATPVVAATPFSAPFPPQPQAAPSTLAGGYPLPVPGSSSSGSDIGSTPFAASGDGTWSGGLRNASQPVSPLQSELQALEVDRSPTLTAGTVYRNRAGESGLSRLTDLQVPVQARIPVGEGKMVVGATPTVIDAGKLSGDYGTRSRFGDGPAGALTDAQRNAPGSQNASGVGLAVGYEGKNLNASVGTTPLGFQETNVIGAVSYGGAVTDTVSLKGELSRRPVTDSLLSFAGTKDPVSGQKWGGGSGVALSPTARAWT
jgi:cellulose synthase operon protein C